MTEKFTRGEWFVEEKSANLHGLTWFGFQVISPEKRKRICYSETDDKKNTPEMQANAALIAAAPEMHRVLSGICLEKSAQICKFAPESCEVCQIRKALKKARGEE